MARNRPAAERQLTPEQITAQEVDRARALRCVELGTCQLLWYRKPDQYKPAKWHWQIGDVCDQIIADARAGISSWWILEAPPRHGKSEHVGRGMGARLMALEPGASVLYCTSTEKRARNVSRAAQQLVERLAPHFPHLERSVPWETTEWVTAGDGGWVGCGAGGSTGGIGAKLVIVDDVTGSARRQRSEAEKDSLWEWLKEDVLSRSENGPVVIMETRRGLDDVIGRIEEEWPGRCKRYTWRFVSDGLEKHTHPKDKRKPGDYLWPEKYGADWHATQPQLRPGERVYETLYRQNPIRTGGEVLLAEWLENRYPGDPRAMRNIADKGTTIAFVDTSSKTEERNDPTGIVIMARFGPKIRILHAEEVKPHDLTSHLADLHSTWSLDGVVEEDTSIAPEIKRQWDRLRAEGRELPPMVLQSVAGGGDKVERMKPFEIRWIAKDYELPRAAPWVAGYKAHMLAVPNGSHDDMWDATTIGFAYYDDGSRKARTTKVRR